MLSNVDCRQSDTCCALLKGTLEQFLRKVVKFLALTVTVVEKQKATNRSRNVLMVNMTLLKR